MLSSSYHHHSNDLGIHTRSRSHSPLKMLPDTSLNRYSSQDEDSGISNSFNGSSRWRNDSNFSASFSSPPKSNYSTLDTTYTSPYHTRDLDTSKSHDFTFKSYDYPKSSAKSHELNSSSLRKNGYSKSVTASSEMDRYSSGRKSSGNHAMYGSLERGVSKRSDAGDVHEQLQESEKRRSLLVEKLTDARNTIQLQSDRLDQAESGCRTTNFSLDDYKQRERDSLTSMYPQTSTARSRFNSKEYKKKIDLLEQEKLENQNRRLDSIKQREELQNRVGGLENEIGLLKTSYTLMETEEKRHSDLLQQKNEALSTMEENNLKLLKTKESLSKEASATKESLDIARNRNDWLENQVQDNKAELILLRKENQTLSTENRNLHNQVCELRESHCVLKEDNATNSSTLKHLQQENLRLQRQADSSSDTIADLKGKLSFITSDKERFFHEKLDLHQKLQTVLLDRDTARTEKNALEEQLNEMNAELAETKLSSDRKREDWHKYQEELAAVKKVGEVLSLELATTKANLEKALERNHSLEETKKIAFQQHTLYEQEIKSLDNQLKSLRKSMEMVEDSHRKERVDLDGSTVRLRDELRIAKDDKNQLQLRLLELEAKNKQAVECGKQEVKSEQQKAESWRETCEKMSASLSRKEMEVQQLSKKLTDLQQQTSYVKLTEQSWLSQGEQLQQLKEETARLENENQRLRQERNENQQVIQLLEMQKSVLAKTSDPSVSKSHDRQSHDRQSHDKLTQLESQVETLTSEKKDCEDRIQQLEGIRDELIREKEQRLANSDAYFTGKKTTGSHAGDASSSNHKDRQIQELEKQNKQLRDINSMVTQQLSRVEQQNTDLRAAEGNGTLKHQVKKLEVEKQILEETHQRLKTQHDHLEEVYQKQREEINSLKGGTPDLVRVRQDNESLQDRVKSLENTIRVAQGDKRHLEEETQSLQRKLANVNQKLVQVSQTPGDLQKTVTQLQTELQTSKNVVAKQDNVIESLKAELEDEKTKKPLYKQSLDDVGTELNVMRKKLQKLMDVIETKDMEIETLGSELETTRKQVSDSREHEHDELEDRLVAMESENHELQSEMKQLIHDLEKSQSEVERLEEQLKLTQSAREEEAQKAGDRLKRELTAKDRQIESLEEQLRRNTSAELRRLKREASKVEILKQENRRLINEMTQVRGAAGKKEGSTTEDHDSWDSDSIHQDGHVQPLRKHLSDELKEAEQEALKEVSEDEDVRKVVAMLENVEFNDTMPLSTYNDDRKLTRGVAVHCDVNYESSEGDNVTPRNDDESPSNKTDDITAARRQSRSPVKAGTDRDKRQASFSGSDQSEEGKKRFSNQDDDGVFPSPKLSNTPKRSSSTNYKLTSHDNDRSRSKSPPHSPSRTYERSRSYERMPRVGSTYEARSQSYDRRPPMRSASQEVTATTGYGSLVSSAGLRHSLGNTDLNVRSMGDSGPRYRSSLTELGPTPGETKDERRKRMRELLRTLDKPRY